jgi:hypothetical protein
VLFIWARVTDNTSQRISELWVAWDKRGAERADEYIFFCTEKEIENQLGTVFFVHQRTAPSFKRVEFVNDRV